MREIKFRAWDGHKMVEPCSIEFENTAYGLGQLGEKYDTLMQFTGLKDKNGKEIYEGDIVKQKYLGVEKEDVYAIPELSRFFHLYGESVLTPDQAEIIGNVYENPNLLTS